MKDDDTCHNIMRGQLLFCQENDIVVKITRFILLLIADLFQLFRTAHGKEVDHQLLNKTLFIPPPHPSGSARGEEQ